MAHLHMPCSSSRICEGETLGVWADDYQRGLGDDYLSGGLGPVAAGGASAH